MINTVYESDKSMNFQKENKLCELNISPVYYTLRVFELLHGCGKAWKN